MKTLLIYIVTILCFSITVSGAQESEKNRNREDADTLKTLSYLKILGEAEGDLNKDGIPEKVIVYDTENETEYGTEREIHIFKKVKNEWVLWKKTVGAVLPSQHGGMMGDPFEGISIERNCIVITHFGGSRQKWNYTHRFRFQNKEWQLIGTTICFGSPCDYFFTFDYNLSTGKIKYKKETESCENDASKTKVEEKELIRKSEVLPSMDGFYPGDNKIDLPGSETIYY